MRPLRDLIRDRPLRLGVVEFEQFEFEFEFEQFEEPDDVWVNVRMKGLRHDSSCGFGVHLGRAFMVRKSLEDWRFLRVFKRHRAG